MSLLKLAQHLKIANNEQQANSAFDNYLKHYDFKSYAFTYYAKHVKSGSKLIYECVSRDLQLWHQHYIEQHYADVDRTLEENHAMTIPLFWDVQEQLTQAKNIREQRIRQESIAFGISKGLSIPVHGPNADFASLTLHQRTNETCLQHYEMMQYEWMNAAQIFYHYLKNIITANISNTKNHPLTKREKQCLALTAKNWRVEMIAKELKISVRTVNFHLQNANKKMGVNNKYLAIITAKDLTIL